MTAITSTATLPIVYGAIQKMGLKSEKKKIILLKDFHNNILASGEYISKAAFDNSKKKHEYRPLNLITEDNKFIRVFVKISTLTPTEGVFKESFSPTQMKKKDSQDAFLRSIMQRQGIDKLQQLTAEDQNLVISIKEKAPNGRIITNNCDLNKWQTLNVVRVIETKKEKWVKEANEKGTWIKKTISVVDSHYGKIKVTVEIFPNTRENVEKLGQIDIRMRQIGSGSLKTVYESFNYEKGITTAGKYGKMNNRMQEEINSQKEIKAGFESGKPSAKKQFALSKATDIKSVKKPSTASKPARAYDKVKLTEKLYEKDSLMNAIETSVLPNGQELTPKLFKTFIIDILKAIDHMDTVGRTHRDIKPENIQLSFSKKLNRYVAKLADFDLSTKIKRDISAHGSPLYAAPEILLLQSFDQRADLYSLGKTMVNQPDPWWIPLDDGAVVLSEPILFAVISTVISEGKSIYYEPEDKNSYQWFNWKLTHPDVEKRFKSAKEALEKLEALPDPSPKIVNLEYEMSLDQDFEMNEAYEAKMREAAQMPPQGY